jgi:hypothetical protein
MTKGVIVVDAPDLCTECDLMCYDQYKDKFCFMVGFDEPIEDDKPDWCPIKPAPEKIQHPSRQSLSQECFADGWNACVDKILGEQKWK